jgi:hypothetical protein
MVPKLLEGVIPSFLKVFPGSLLLDATVKYRKQLS